MKGNVVKKLGLGIFGLLCLVGCGNQQIFDTTYRYDYAEIKLPSGEVVSGKVDSWKDYSDSDSVQVVIDGVSYYTHIVNVVLRADKK